MCRCTFHWAWLVSGLLMAGSLLGCDHQNDPSSGPMIPVVRVSEPVKKEVQDYEYFTGRTDAVHNVEIRAQVTGYLTKFHFKPGVEVKDKEDLFQIDPRPYQAALDLAKSQVAQNKARLELAIAKKLRGDEVAKTPGAISKQELDELAAKEKEAAAEVKSAEANAESARLNLEYTDIKSPITGIVGRDLLPVGSLIKNGSLLTTVVSMDPIYVYFNVDENAMLRVQKMIREGKIKSIREGGKVPVAFGLANENGAYPHEGSLDFANNELDSSTGTLQVRGLLDNPPLQLKKITYVLSPGLFVRVRFPLGDPHQALLVPQAALGTDLSKKFVLVVNENNIVEKREVIPAAEQPNGWQEVLPVKIKITKNGAEQEIDSLSAKDKIIIGGLQRVREGSKVKIKPSN